VVVIPDFGGGLDTLDASVDRLEGWGVPYLLDPVVEPIGFGFMASLERYAEARRRYPEGPMLMGIGNITELTAADSTGVNAVLIASSLGTGQALASNALLISTAGAVVTVTLLLIFLQGTLQ
jgi:hypothetical protein